MCLIRSLWPFSAIGELLQYIFWDFVQSSVKRLKSIMLSRWIVFLFTKNIRLNYFPCSWKRGIYCTLLGSIFWISRQLLYFFYLLNHKNSITNLQKTFHCYYVAFKMDTDFCYLKFSKEHDSCSWLHMVKYVLCIGSVLYYVYCIGNDFN